MLLNERSLTDGLRNSFNLTNQEVYVRLVYEKGIKKTIASLHAAPSPSCAHFDFPPSLRLTSLPFYGLPHRLG